MRQSQLLITLFLLFAITAPTYARWATPGDLDIETESFKRDIFIRKDGTSTETIELTLIATKESGKDKLISYPLSYTAKSTELKIIEAKTILNNTEYPVDLKDIEDKPLASSPQGFDQKHQILVAFPEIQVNGKIYIKYKITTKEIPVPGFYATDFIFGEDSNWKKSDIHIKSELPLYIESNDTEKVLEIKQKKINHLYQIDINLKKPTIRVPIDEDNIYFDGKLLPWVSISTLQDWSVLGNKMADQYEAILNEPLPPLFETIAMHAQKQSSLIDKINLVTVRLSEQLTYMGDWRTVKGACVPRALAEVAKTKMGDCKDFSAATTAILRRLGIKAHAVLIHRGIFPDISPNHLPTLYAFNHAITAVEDENNKDNNDLKILWIDPTNFSSYAQGIYPDIANRKALVLISQNSSLKQTQALTSRDAKAIVSNKITFPQNEPDLAYSEGKIALFGTFALQLTGADLRDSKMSIDHQIIGMMSDQNRVIQWHVEPYNLTSRIVRDLNFSYHLTEKNTRMKTSAGDAFLLPSSHLVSRFLTKTKDRVTDLYIGQPSLVEINIFLPKVTLINKKDLSCHIESPWFEASRQITQDSNGIKIIDKRTNLKDKILNTELHSIEYTEFQRQLFTCFGEKTALVYQH